MPALITVASMKELNLQGLEFLGSFAMSYGFSIIDYIEACLYGRQNIIKSLCREFKKSPIDNQCPVY